MLKTSRTLGVLLAVAGLAPVAVAQDGAPAPQDPSVTRAAVAAERTSPVRIDGRLDEAAWQAATPVGEARPSPRFIVRRAP